MAEGAEHCLSKCGDASSDIEEAGGLGTWARATREQRADGSWHTSSSDSKLLPLVGQDISASITIPLVDSDANTTRNTFERIESKGTVWMKPRTLSQLTRLRISHPEARILGGETDFTRGARNRAKVFLDVTGVAELGMIVEHIFEQREHFIALGGAVTVARAIEAIDESLKKGEISSMDTASRHSRASAVRDALARLGTPQNRNSMAVGSHLSAGDLAPVLAVCGAIVDTTAEAGCPFQAWHAGARDGVVIRVSIPAPGASVSELDDELEHTASFKSAPRRIGAIGTVAASFSVRIVADLRGNCWRIRQARCCFSGCGPRGLLHADLTAATLYSSSNDADGFQINSFGVVAAALVSDIGPCESIIGSLAASLLFRFMVETAESIEAFTQNSVSALPPPPHISPRDRSATTSLHGSGLGGRTDLFGTTALRTPSTPGTSRALTSGAQAWTQVEGKIQTALGGDIYRDNAGNTLEWNQDKSEKGPHASEEQGHLGAPVSRAPVGLPLKHAAAIQQVSLSPAFELN